MGGMLYDKRIVLAFVLVVCACVVMVILRTDNWDGFIKKSSLYDSATRFFATDKPKPKPYEVTVVTMYVPLGTFQKGAGGMYTNDRYRGWMQTFGWLENKLVAFFVDDDTLEYFKKIRAHLPPEKNVFIRLNRSDLKSFRDYDKVNQIYSTPNYPKHHPNTVNANYSVVMNAKYEVLQMAIDLGHVDTEYLAWLDIGCFRNLVGPDLRPKNNSFTLQVPFDFDKTKIGFTEVGSRNSLRTLSAWDYIQRNEVWVAGSFSIGSVHVFPEFIKSYNRTVQALLKENMASTDQQMIGAMYSPKMVNDQKVDLQLYKCRDGQYGLYSSDIAYFCLAYICKEAAELRKSNHTIV